MKLGFFGFGHLARSICTGIGKNKVLDEKDIFMCARSAETSAYALGLGYNVCKDINELFKLCDVVIIAIKPQVFRELKEVLKESDTHGKRVVSVMASVSAQEVSSVFGCPVMRLMPSVAISECRDVIGCFCGKEFDDVVNLLTKLGDVLMLDEDKLDRLTVAASCGLGFAANILEAYKKQCVDFGFSEEEAEQITKSMFGYAVNAESFAGLRDAVATKGGSTEAGVSAMNASLETAISDAFTASADKAIPKK